MCLGFVALAAFVVLDALSEFIPMLLVLSALVSLRFLVDYESAFVSSLARSWSLIQPPTVLTLLTAWRSM